MFRPALLFLITTLFGYAYAAIYPLAKEYSGVNFFDDWDFVLGKAPSDKGFQNYLTGSSALNRQLAFVSTANHAVIRVDNTTNITSSPQMMLRDSVRIKTKDAYNTGSVWLVDIIHSPFGCGVQPSFSSLDKKGFDSAGLENNGQVTTFEGADKDASSQMSLYTGRKLCNASISNPSQNPRSIVNTTDCSDQIQGCTITNAGFPSYGPGFNTPGGGLYVTEYALSGMSIWFIPRQNVSSSLLNSSSIDTSKLGIPVANWAPTICGFGGFNDTFGPQYLSIEIKLCNIYDGGRYFRTCLPGDCYSENVVGNGSNFEQAYFEIGSVRVFSVNDTSPSSTGQRTGNTVMASPSPASIVVGAAVRDSTDPNAVIASPSPASIIIGAAVGGVVGVVTTFFVALCCFKKRVQRRRMAGLWKSRPDSASIPVPFLSRRRRRRTVPDTVNNPMQEPPIPKVPERPMDATTSPLPVPASAPAPDRVPEIMEDSSPAFPNQAVTNLIDNSVPDVSFPVAEPVTVVPVPTNTAELLREIEVLRRRLAEVTEHASVLGDTPPPTYHDGEEYGDNNIT